MKKPDDTCECTACSARRQSAESQMFPGAAVIAVVAISVCVVVTGLMVIIWKLAL